MGYSLLAKRKGQGAKGETLTKITCVGRGCSGVCSMCSRCQIPLYLFSNGPCFLKYSLCMGMEEDKYGIMRDFSRGIKIWR